MKNNRTIRRKVLTALTLFWMLFIFTMSSAVSTVSDYQSDSFIDFLCTIFVKGYTEMPPAKKMELQDKGTFPVRKCAHMTEYAILGALLSLTITEYLQDSDSAQQKRHDKSASRKEQSNSESQTKQSSFASKILRLAVFIGFLYACTDAFHQTFVPGRSGEFRDILIDTFGVLLGTLIITRLLPSLARHRTAEGKTGQKYN